MISWQVTDKCRAKVTDKSRTSAGQVPGKVTENPREGRGELLGNVPGKVLDNLRKSHGELPDKSQTKAGKRMANALHI